MDTHKPPHTEILEETSPSGAKSDACFLVYQNKKIRLNSTEYAIATSMLSPAGLDLAEVGEERQAIQRRSNAAAMNEFVAAGNFLCSLRKKVEECFGDELMVPRACRGVSSAGLRIWTKDEFEEFRQTTLNPDRGFVDARAPNLQWLVFVNGHEVKPQGRSGMSVLDHEILKRAYSPKGFCVHAPEFKAICAELSGQETIAPASLATRLSSLRVALKAAGMELTNGNKIRGDFLGEQVYRITPPIPKISKNGLRQVSVTRALEPEPA